MQYSEDLSQRIEDCRELYFKHGGKNHELIEKEMRDMGYRDFHRRKLYRRFERGTCRPGWIETYGWDYLLKMHNAQCKVQNDNMLLSPTGTNNIAQGKAEPGPPRGHPEAGWGGRNPGYGDPYSPDPEGVEQTAGDVAPLQGAETDATCPGVTPASRAHPRLYSLSPSATGKPLPDFDEFKEWLKRTWPNMTWEWKHQVYIYKRLKRITDGDSKRLMIFMPPRHGKSELVTVRFPAWTLKHRPETKIIVASYNQSLANRFSRMVRSALAEDAYQMRNAECKVQNEEAQPRELNNDNQHRPQINADDADKDQNTIISSSALSASSAVKSLWPIRIRSKNSEAEWETAQGGGVRAVGMGAGVTGYGANLIIIDDPVKSRAEAESETIREKVWNWFNDDIYTRLAPDGKIILIQTRWHEDDLAGRLLREAAEEGGEQWDVISLPAVAEMRKDECGMMNEEETSHSELHIPDSDKIHHSSFIIHHSSFDLPSGTRSRRGPLPRTLRRKRPRPH